MAAKVKAWTERGRRLSRLPRRCLLVLIVFAVLVPAALAYWTGTGSGSATTNLPDVAQLPLSPGTPIAQLYPGGVAGVAIVAHNPNDFFVDIDSLELDGTVAQPFAVDAAHSGCDVSVLSFVTQDNGGAGWRVPPRVGSTDGRLTIDLDAAMGMSAQAADACQGATFTVALVAVD